MNATERNDNSNRVIGYDLILSVLVFSVLNQLYQLREKNQSKYQIYYSLSYYFITHA